MGPDLIGFGVVSKRFWRLLLGIGVAYAVAAQSFLFAFGSWAAPTDTGAPAFELCLHDGRIAPGSSDGVPRHPGCMHCIFCFSGSYHAFAAAPPALFHRANIVTVDMPRVSNQHALTRPSDYSIASPRGPPALA